MGLVDNKRPCDICGDSNKRQKGELKERTYKPPDAAKDSSESMYYSHEYCFKQMEQKANAWNNPPEDKDDDPFNETRKIN